MNKYEKTNEKSGTPVSWATFPTGASRGSAQAPRFPSVSPPHRTIYSEGNKVSDRGPAPPAARPRGQPLMDKILEPEIVDIYEEAHGPVTPFSVPHTLSYKGYNFSARQRGYLDTMALVSAMDSGFYGQHRAHLGEPLPSPMILRMADGSKKPSIGRITVDLVLNYEGGRISAPCTMEIIESNERWDVLFGLPVLRQMKARIDLDKNELQVRGGQAWRSFRAYSNVEVVPGYQEAALWTALTEEPDLSVIPDLSATPAEPANRAQKILSMIQIGDSLTAEQRRVVESFIVENHEAWALNLSELEATNVGMADLEVDESVRLPLQASQRLSKQETDAASAYVDVLLAAGLVRPIEPGQVKCVSNVIMIPKKTAAVKEDDVVKELDEAIVKSGPTPVGWAPFPAGATSMGRRPPHPPPVSNAPHHIDKRTGSTAEMNPVIDPTTLYRMVFNFRPLNRATKTAPYLPGDMHTLIAKTSGKKYISVVDQLGAFYSFPLAKKSQPYTSFFIPGRGHFCHTRMAQGLNGSPATMQAGAAKAYTGMLGKEAEIWMDDLFTSSDSFDEHMDVLRRLAKRAIQHKLRWSPAKTKLFQTKTSIGGQLVSQAGVEADPSRIQAIVELAKPRSALQTLSFVNKAAHFRRAIKDFAVIAAPLTDLTRNIAPANRQTRGSLKRALEATDVQSVWGDKHQAAFDALKAALGNLAITSAPVYDGKTPFHVEVDACADGFGAHLYQVVDGESRTIEFASRRTTAKEQLSHSFTLELKGVRWALDRFKPFIHGQPVILHTDCQAVKNLLNHDKPTFQHASWKNAILDSGSKIKFVHKAGAENVVADYLSRNAVGPTPMDSLEEGQPMKILNDLCWIDRKGPEEELLRKRFQGDVLYGVVCFLTKLINSDDDAVVKKAEQYLVRDGKLWTRNKALGHEMEVVPQKEGPELAKKGHAEGGHFSVELTIRHIQKNYHWQTIRKDVTNAVDTCVACDKFGPRVRNSLMRETLRYAPFDLIAMDYLFLPKTSKGFRIALIAVDSYTKFIFGWVFDRDPSSATCLIAINDLRQKYLLPTEIVCDNQFMTNEIKRALLDKTTLTPAAPFAHAPSAENANHLVLDRLKRLCRVDLDDVGALLNDENAFEIWPSRLQDAIAALNDRKLSALGGYSPRELMFGKTDRRPIPIRLQPHVKRMDLIRTEAASDRDKEADIRQKKDHKPVQPFSVGQLVQIYDPRKDATHESTRKLKMKWSGPYRVIETSRGSVHISTVDGHPAGRVGNDRARLWKGLMMVDERGGG